MAKKKVNKCMQDNGCGGFAYFLGVIGALIHYLSTAIGFWSGVLGVLKSLIWPTMVVLNLLKFLAM